MSECKEVLAELNAFFKYHLFVGNMHAHVPSVEQGLLELEKKVMSVITEDEDEIAFKKIAMMEGDFDGPIN